MTDDPRPGAGGEPTRSPWRRVLRAIAAVFLIIYVVIDELLTRVLWPAIAQLSRLPVFRWVGNAIAALPPYGVLVLLAIPFVLIEPFKVFALYWIASGHLVQGPIILVLSYVLSILSCDRIYHAGHAKLMQIGWFKTIMDWIIALRNRAIGWVKATPLWHAVAAFMARCRGAIASAIGRLKAMLGSV